MIRVATLTDLPALENLARELVPRVPVPDFRYLTDPIYFCVISDQGGYIFARIDQWNGELVGFVISTAARKDVPLEDRIDGNGLLESWARTMGVKKLLTITPTPEVFLKRWGFKLESFVISREIPQR
jgi:hypothetical protein